ncbi:hypothetical protein A7A78_04875 [Aequorivita soesokkakensis]|uniref:Fibronectin type-III domain-containing protein n=1 Tax=Aequorivita soesokkakensis TaxID=1385699 RepID=A0A1A9LDK0_9FLAO|nr:M4 family metallopeptidase [Aequorivita soesokkakensis]OAD91147.1 hypothetical protein A7A78_04875 [Aequorivita soesokkakensis]
MKKINKFVFLFSLIIFVFSADVSAQNKNDEKRNVKQPPSLKVFDASQSYSLQNSSQIFKEVLNPSSETSFTTLKQEQDPLGFTHQKMQQYYKGVKVEFGTVVLHSKEGSVKSLSSEFYRINEFDVTPTISKSQAFNKAINHIGAQNYMWEYPDAAKEMDNYTKPEGELVILPDFSSADNIKEINAYKLAYKFDIFATNPISRGYLYIDAKNGQPLFYDAIIKHATDMGFVGKAKATVETETEFCERIAVEELPVVLASGTAQTRYSGTRTIETALSGGSYILSDAGRKVYTRDALHQAAASPYPYVNNYQQFTDNDNNWTTAEHSANKDNAALDAHWGAMMTYDYWQQKHGRNSYDGNGAQIRSYVHVGTNYDNAFWNGSVMSYGDGSCVSEGCNGFDALTSIDVAAHEIGHAVTTYTANLAYQRESGGLNEGFSDIWGAAIEHFAKGNGSDTNPSAAVWLIGDEIDRRSGSAALRSMSNPTSQGQPDTYGGQYWQNPNCGTPTQYNDYCGVHTNSGVLNHWFYRTVVGGSGTNDIGNSFNISGIGMTKASNIAYRTLSFYLSANSTYANARTGAIQAAIDLYGAGSAEEEAVTNAWYAVGVGSAYDGGGDPPPGDCQTGDIYLSITFDNYPEETGWTLKNSSGTTIDSASYTSANPDGSTVTRTFSSLAVGDYTFTITDAYGDGICCSYGNGSYTLSSDAGVIFSGGSFGSSETTAFCIEAGTGGDTQAPSTPTNLVASNVTQTTATLSWNASTDNVGVTGYDVFQGSTNIGTVTGTSANITGLVASTAYSFKVRAHDAAGNNSGFSNTVNFTTQSNSITYCASKGNNSSYEWIDLVKLNNLNKSSGNDGGYKDNTSLSANVGYGSNTIQYSAGFSSGSYREYWRVWIDFNHNGTFDSNELMVNRNSTSSGTLSSSFTVPTSALSGPTRMRVSMKYSSSQSACETFSYGEVEDYTVNIGTNPVQGIDGGNNSLSNAEMTLYPNPAKHTLNISLIDAAGKDYVIYNTVGQVVGKGAYTENVDVSSLQSGIYIIEVNTENNKLMKRFVKE